MKYDFLSIQFFGDGGGWVWWGWGGGWVGVVGLGWGLGGWGVGVGGFLQSGSPNAHHNETDIVNCCNRVLLDVKKIPLFANCKPFDGEILNLLIFNGFPYIETPKIRKT